MRIVLDTNVIVSGLLWGGPPNQLLRWARSRILEVLCCGPLLAEVQRVLAYPRIARRISALGSTEQQTSAYLMNMVVHVPAPDPVPAVVQADPSDDLFLALAAQNRARLISSGDEHLVALREYQLIPILAPGEAVAVVSELLARQRG